MAKKSPLTHRQRMEAVLGEKKTDRTPVSLWRHFPVDDQTPGGLAAAIASFQKLYDFDFIKVTPASSYCIKDWGAMDIWRGSPEGTREYIEPVINRFDDWRQLKPLNPRVGWLGKSIESLKFLINEFSPHTPIIQTIFSPLSQAKNLVGKDNLLYHLRACPEALHLGLETITTSTLEYIEEIKKIGVDGIFFAIQHAQFDLLSIPEFEAFCRHYDLKTLRNATDFWLNIGHVHGENILFDQVMDYPVNILNWHDRQTSPTLAEAQHRYKGTVCGGLKQWETMLLGDKQAVVKEAKDAIRQTNGFRFVLGTGCVIPITTPHGNILAARRAVDN
ncbi:MAG: uroporphyrinogen decarboxylase family protein [Bellilinea sp.]|jgi:uroporphyrinogen decarboxylase